MNREILLATLKFYAIQGMSEDWLRYYLNVRREKVKVT